MSGRTEATASDLQGLISGDEIRSSPRYKNTQYHERTFPQSEETLRLTEGWEVVRHNRNTVRLRKPKPIDEQLEDRIWRLFARMGFKLLSRDRRFMIQIDTSGAGAPPKQIDVFAADDETAIVVECKTSESPRNRSLQKDLSETKGLQNAIRQAIHKGLIGERRRVVFVYATHNIQWSQQDFARAQEFNIAIIKDSQIGYFEKLVDLVGHAARHQLQAEILAGSQVAGLNAQIPALRGSFGKINFYQFAIEPEQLLKLVYVSHRAQVDEETVGTYQRLLSKGRLKSIAQHINDTGGVFPTNIVVNFRSHRRLRFDAATPTNGMATVLGTLYLPPVYKSAYLIDGQHRLYGFALSDWAATGRIPVLAFDGLSPQEEVKMFVEINSKQVKVPPRLLAELEPELLKELPGTRTTLRRIASRVVDELNRRADSPIHDRIAGEWDTDKRKRPITRPLLRNAIEQSQLLGAVRGEILHPSPFNLGEEDATVERAYQAISTYIKLFATNSSQHWTRMDGPGGFLCTNNGIRAILRLFNESLRHVGLLDSQEDQSKVHPALIVEKVRHLTVPVTEYFAQATETDVAPFRREYGSGGQAKVAFRLFDVVHNAFPNFEPRGLLEFLRDRDQALIDRAAQLARSIESNVRTITFNVLDHAYGNTVLEWWPEAVPENIRVKAVQKMETSPDRGDPHRYLDLLDYKVIVENSRNWQHFNGLLAVESQNRSKAEQLSWLVRLNSIRNRVSHTGRDQYITPDEVTWLQDVATKIEFLQRNVPS